MNNCHIGLIWFINNILLFVALSLSVAIAIYSAVKKVFADRSIRKLAIIKNDLHHLAKSGAEGIKNICPKIIGEITREQFFEITKDKRSVMPEKFQQQLKDCFINSGKISEIESVAAGSGNKWGKIPAIISLGYTESRNALGILKSSIYDKDEDISYFSMLALAQIKNKASAGILLDYLSSHSYSGRKVISLLESFPAGIIAEEALKAAENKNPSVRFWAVKLISKFKLKEAHKKIEGLLNDKSADVRAASCECLGELKEKSSEPALLACLKDKIWFVRMHAIRALCKLPGVDCRKEAAKLLDDRVWLVREAAKKTMEKF